MSPSNPFIDRETGQIDTDRVLVEAIPIAKLIGLFVAIALVPLLVVFVLVGNSAIGMLFILVAQFVLAVGAGVVLLYIITRAIRLANE